MRKRICALIAAALLFLCACARHTVVALDELERPAFAADDAVQAYVLNTSSKKFHLPSCPSAQKISEKNRWDFEGSRDEVLAMGYAPCAHCDP